MAVVLVVVVVAVAETVAETIAGGVGAVTPAVVVVVTPVVAGVVTTTPMVVATSNSTNKTNMRCWLRALARGPWLRGVRSSLPGTMAVTAVLRPPTVAGKSISTSTVRSALPGTMAVLAVVEVLAVPAALEVL